MKISAFLRDERGQLVPFIAVSLLLVIMFSAFGIGLTSVYRDRIRIRDALDAAASAALTAGTRVEERATYLYEVKVCRERNEEGECIDWDWVKKSKSYKPYIVIDEYTAEKAARAYFDKNMYMDGLEYKIKEWDIDFRLEPRELQIHVDRPHTEGRVTTYLDDFPRYVEVILNAEIETKVPMGTVVKHETVRTRMGTKQLVELD